MESFIHLTLFNNECVRKLHLHINQVTNLKTLLSQRKNEWALLFNKRKILPMMSNYLS